LNRILHRAISFSLLGLICSALFKLQIAHGSNSNLFRVALRVLPTNLDPRNNQVNTNHYLLLQLYFPLFQKSESGELKSEFLDLAKTKSLDGRFKSFQFCLKSGLQFSDGAEVGRVDLVQTIAETHRIQEVLPKLVSIKNNDGDSACITVEIDRSDLRYFDKFQGVASTILKSTGERQSFPIGMGPYKVEFSSSEKIVLGRRAIGGSDQVNKIEFVKFKSVAEALSEKVDDWNHIYQIDIPPQVVEASKAIPSPIVKVYALVINLEDRNLRKRLISCLSKVGISKSLGIPVEKTKGFLPTGVMGFDVDMPTGTQHDCEGDHKIRAIDFLTSREADALAVPILFSSGPFRVNPKILNSDKMVMRVFSRTPYLAVIGFDSSGSQDSDSGEASIFFESFIRDERLVSSVPKGLTRAVEKAAQASARADKIEFYRQAHKILLDSGYVLPVGQLKASQYYPKRFSNIQWADRISGFPAIEKMVVQQ
jgi:ABC-type transport system substrate-binding protein